MKYVISFLILITVSSIGFLVYRTYGPVQNEASLRTESCKDLSVVMFMWPSCKYCKMAKDVFDRYKIDYRPIDVTADPQKQQSMMKITGQSSVPQIFIEGIHIGGYSELSKLEETGKLARFLKSCDPTLLQE